MLLAGYFGGSNFEVIFFQITYFSKKIDKHFMYLLIFGDNCHRLLDIDFVKQLTMLKVNKIFVKDIDLSKFV